jgi:hypothetical protein
MGIWVAKLASRSFPTRFELEYRWLLVLPNTVRLSPAHTLCGCGNHTPMRARAYSSALGSTRSFQQCRHTRARIRLLGCTELQGASSASPTGCPARHLRHILPPLILLSRTRRPRTRAPRSSSCGSDVAGTETGRPPLMACSWRAADQAQELLR